MSPDDRTRLEHMAEALDAATRFAEGRSRSDLDEDQMLLFALVRAFEIVGEAASKVSSAGRTELPQLPWPLMIGMRHRLVHAYFDIDREILWDTVIVAVPPIATQLREFLADREH